MPIDVEWQTVGITAEMSLNPTVNIARWIAVTEKPFFCLTTGIQYRNVTVYTLNIYT